MENFNQLCVWPGTLLEANQVEEFTSFFKEEMGVRVQFKTVIFTNPDLDGSGQPVEDTGGRSDLFFYIHDEDVTKFAVPRLEMGIRWWEDVIKYNDNSHLYPAEFIQENPPTW